MIYFCQTMKKMLITGATNGIGAAAIRQLKDTEVHPILLARSEKKAQEILREIGRGDYYVCDLSDTMSVLQAAQEIISKETTIDYFIANAGVIGYKDTRKTGEGVEMTMQVNFLSHALLVEQLLPVFEKSGTVLAFTSSMLHRSYWLANYDFSTSLNATKHSQFKSYSRSKAAICTYAMWLAKNEKIRVHLLDPGVAATGITRSREDWMDKAMNSVGFLFSKPESSARTILRLIQDEKYKRLSGIYLTKNRDKSPDKRAMETTTQRSLLDQIKKHLPAV